MEHTVKCACPSCHCAVAPGHGVVRDGQRYCSPACAYDCTQTTCVCVHEHCDDADADDADPPEPPAR